MDTNEHEWTVKKIIQNLKEKKGGDGRGKGAGEEKNVEFKREKEKAMADAELRDLTNINKAAAAGIWQASAWRLERKFPKKWSRRVFVEQPKEGKPKAPKVIGCNRPVVPGES